MRSCYFVYDRRSGRTQFSVEVVDALPFAVLRQSGGRTGDLDTDAWGALLIALCGTESDAELLARTKNEAQSENR